MRDLPTEFNVRIYGLFIHNHHLLVSDELLQGKPFTKLPGGGLEFGESPIDCLHREAQEEMAAQITVERHFYTTDQFIQSHFRPWQQVICSYYLCRFKNPKNIKTSEKKMDFDYALKENQESFRWVELIKLSQEKFDFLSDQSAIDKLINNTVEGS